MAVTIQKNVRRDFGEFLMRQTGIAVFKKRLKWNAIGALN